MSEPIKLIGPSVRFRNFGVNTVRQKSIAARPPEGINAKKWGIMGSDYILKIIQQDTLDTDIVGFKLCSPNISHAGEITYTSASEITPKSIHDNIRSISDNIDDRADSWGHMFELIIYNLHSPLK